MLAARAQHAPEAVALHERDTSYTYGDLWQSVQKFALNLRAQGLGPGDRVAVLNNKTIDTVVALFGAAAARMVFVPVNPVLKSDQVRHILSDSGAQILVTSSARLSQLDLSDVEIRVTCIDNDDAGDIPWRSFNEQALVPLDDAQEDDVVSILYTSGSTGKPKGVVLSQANMTVGAASVAEYLNNSPEDVILSLLPLSFDAGLSQLTTAFHSGASVVLLDYLLPQDVVKAVTKYAVTGITGVPPLWHQIAGCKWEEVGHQLRYFANTGGKMPRNLLESLRTVFPKASPFLMYGLTEAFRSTYLDPQQVDARPDSIGKAIPNAVVSVIGKDGKPCAPGEPGELVHSGPLVALGYWNNKEKTAERFKPSPLAAPELPNPPFAVWSGDQVMQDEEGYLYFVGREDEMIKSSGYRISPTEVEEALMAISSVNEAVVFGVEDEGIGQRIVAVLSGDAAQEKELKKELVSALPNFMVPHEFNWLDDLPKNPNGKIDRSRILSELQMRIA